MGNFLKKYSGLPQLHFTSFTIIILLSSINFRKFGKVPLASQSWEHRKTNNDYFTINSHKPNPSFLHSDEDFASLNLHEPLTAALASLGYVKPTLIQKLACKPVLKGENCLIAAETGSGKTLSYLIPLIQNLLQHKRTFPSSQRPMNSPLVIVLTPGRELCEQISEVAEKLISMFPSENIKSQCITGGMLFILKI